MSKHLWSIPWQHTLCSGRRLCGLGREVETNSFDHTVLFFLISPLHNQYRVSRFGRWVRAENPQFSIMAMARIIWWLLLLKLIAFPKTTSTERTALIVLSRAWLFPMILSLGLTNFYLKIFLESKPGKSITLKRVKKKIKTLAEILMTEFPKFFTCSNIFVEFCHQIIFFKCGLQCHTTPLIFSWGQEWRGWMSCSK